MLYFKIDPILHSIIGIVAGVFEEYNTKESSLLNEKGFLVEVIKTVPAFDSETEYLSLPVDSYDYASNSATRVYTKLTKTQEQLDAEQVASDIELLQDYGKDTILVLVQLVSKLLDDAVIASTDFDPAVKDAYLEIKEIADRIITNQ